MPRPETPPRNRRVRRPWGLVLLGFVWAGIGCSPAALSFLVLPWVDDKIPAKCKLASPDKEVTVAVVSWFGSLEVRPEIMPAEAELSERVCTQLRERFKYNKEKVKIVPPSQVRAFQNKLTGNGPWSPIEIGKQVKADYVVALEINSLSVYEYKSRQLFRGNTEVSVKAYDLAKPEGEQGIFEEIYRREYPRAQPVDASSTSVIQFRTRFLDRIAQDVSKLFSAYPYDQRLDMD
jgi:hypothetical protein